MLIDRAGLKGAAVPGPTEHAQVDSNSLNAIIDTAIDQVLIN
jgi:hypothetical protein